MTTYKNTPRLLGIASVAVGFCGIALKLLGCDVPMMVYFPIGIFELALGLWLVVKGARGDWLVPA